VIAFDPKETKYRFCTFLARGMRGEHDPKIVSAGCEKVSEVPGGTIRHTIETADDVWNEIGEFSKDG
jgi:hypothetical protein